VVVVVVVVVGAGGGGAAGWVGQASTSPAVHRSVAIHDSAGIWFAPRSGPSWSRPTSLSEQSGWASKESK
jgi:hypothetical protein